MLAIEEELSHLGAFEQYSTRQERILYGVAAIQVDILKALREIAVNQREMITEIRNLHLAKGGVVSPSEPYLVGSQSQDFAETLPKGLPKSRPQIPREKSR